jgi:hypothetical protein
MPPSGSELSGVPLPEPGPKLLFDENLAPRLVLALADLYPNSAHVTNVGLEGAHPIPLFGRMLPQRASFSSRRTRISTD